MHQVSVTCRSLVFCRALCFAVSLCCLNVMMVIKLHTAKQASTAYKNVFMHCEVGQDLAVNSLC